MRIGRIIRSWWLDILALVAVFIVFVVPFIFILFTASKSRIEAARFEFSPPTEWLLFQNLAEVLDNPGAAHRLTRAWTTPAEGRQILTQVLEIHASTHLRTEIAVHQIEAELAA